MESNRLDMLLQIMAAMPPDNEKYDALLQEIKEELTNMEMASKQKQEEALRERQVEAEKLAEEKRKAKERMEIRESVREELDRVSQVRRTPRERLEDYLDVQKSQGALPTLSDIAAMDPNDPKRLSLLSELKKKARVYNQNEDVSRLVEMYDSDSKRKGNRVERHHEYEPALFQKDTRPVSERLLSLMSYLPAKTSSERETKKILLELGHEAKKLEDQLSAIKSILNETKEEKG